MDIKEIEKRFTFHPINKDKSIKCSEIRAVSCNLAFLLNDFCPESREKSLAFTALEETVMWANACIARDDSK